MGGSNSSTYFGSEESVFDSFFSCEKINIISNIASPKSSVLKSIKVGDFLQYELHENEILIAKYKDEILGSIVNAKIQEIINCIKSGTQISIQVTEIYTGICRVLLKTK